MKLKIYSFLIPMILFCVFTELGVAQTDGDVQKQKIVNAENAGPESTAAPGNNEAYRIRIHRDELKLYLYKGDVQVKAFKISVGSDRIGKPTPAGKFRVISKVKNPETHWSDGTVIPAGDWRNPYGPRWLGLGDYKTGKYRGYGIHGTNSPEDIGKKISIGCIRMYNEDVLELFNTIKINTGVVIE